MATKNKILFVSFRNTCRSPMAEAIMKKVVFENFAAHKWEIDSAGIAELNVGNPLDPRALEILRSEGIDCIHHSRKISQYDFNKYDFIFAMDEESLDEAISRSPPMYANKIRLLGAFDPNGQRVIDDPFFGNLHSFRICYEHCERCILNFFEIFRFH